MAALPGWGPVNQPDPRGPGGVRSASIVNLLSDIISVSKTATFGKPGDQRTSADLRADGLVLESWIPASFRKQVEFDGFLIGLNIEVRGTVEAEIVKTAFIEGTWPAGPQANPSGLVTTISNGSPALGTGLEQPNPQWHTYVFTENEGGDPANPAPGSVYNITAADIGCGLIFLGDQGGPFTDCRINFPTPGDGGGNPALPRLTQYDNLTFTIINLNSNPVTLSIGQGANYPLPAGVNCSTRGTNVITVVTTLKGEANGIAADGGSVTFRIEVVTPPDGATTPLYAETYNLWAY